MVHNGIEYGMMAAYAEGLNILKHANVGKSERTKRRRDDAAAYPDHYQYDLDLKDIAEVWRRNSVIASWLLDLTSTALMKDPALTKFGGRVSDSARAVGRSRRRLKKASRPTC